VEVIDNLLSLVRPAREVNYPYLSFERGDGEQLRSGIDVVGFQHGERGGPGLLLLNKVSARGADGQHDLPISETPRETCVPSPSPCDSPPTTWCCAPPAQAQRPAGLRWRPC